MLPQHSPEGLPGEASIESFCSGILFFLGKKWLPACLGGGGFPVQCFFPRKRLLYQVFNFAWRAENNIQPTRLKFSIHPWTRCVRSGPCSHKFCPKSCRQTYNRLMIVFSSLSFLVPALLPLASLSSSSVWSLFCEMIPLGKEMVVFIFLWVCLFFVQSVTVHELDLSLDMGEWVFTGQGWQPSLLLVLNWKEWIIIPKYSNVMVPGLCFNENTKKVTSWLLHREKNGKS